MLQTKTFNGEIMNIPHFIKALSSKKNYTVDCSEFNVVSVSKVNIISNKNNKKSSIEVSKFERQH